MIKNYLKVAWRNIWKNKSFSLLNIVGLTAGTVCCIYILLYVRSQYGYDKQFTDAESLFRIRTEIEGKGGATSRPIPFNSACSSPPIAMQMKRDFPEVMAATRIVYFSDGANNMIRKVGSNNGFYESRGYLVDSTFFQVFDFRFTEGRASNSLDEPYTVVLSTELAKKLFGREQAVGQQINIATQFDKHDYKITGVYDENYGKSHLNPHFIMTMNSGGFGQFVRNEDEWAGQNFIYSYVRLNPNADPAVVQSKLPAFLQKYGEKDLKRLVMNKHLYLQKVTDIHLHSKGIGSQLEKTSDASFLNLLLTIAFFIQLIACINFINLTTARSMKRAREIGVRKVVGAMKSSLIFQFLSESVMVAMISVLLAIPTVGLLLPELNTLTESSLTLDALKSAPVIAIILGLGLFTGLLAGIYPALYLSGFNPVSVLKGTFSFKGASVFLRKGLVVFQFVIAIVLIISVLVISGQLRFMQNMDMGFNKELKIIIPLQNQDSRNQFTNLRNELGALKDINGVAGCNAYPSRLVLSDFIVYTKGHDMSSGKVAKANNADENFFNVMGLKILQGRNLRPSDTSGQVVANELLLKQLDIPKDEAIGAKLYAEVGDRKPEFEIVGVCNDYIFNSMKSEMQPLITFYTSRPNYIVAGTTTTDYRGLLSQVGTAWKKALPGVPFEYSFLDKDLEKQYRQEATLRKISNSFTLLAIIISCLGLFGLAMFTAQQRIKEIGVRKVLGASVTGIITMLSKDFLKLVLLSIIIASPIAWWAMNKWLSEFTYKLPLSWWTFVLAGAMAIIIAFITVSFQAIKAAIANPVRSLRSE
jgi:putative ABC transport system permease protein